MKSRVNIPLNRSLPNFRMSTWNRIKRALGDACLPKSDFTGVILQLLQDEGNQTVLLHRSSLVQFALSLRSFRANVSRASIRGSLEFAFETPCIIAVAPTQRPYVPRSLLTVSGWPDGHRINTRRVHTHVQARTHTRIRKHSVHITHTHAIDLTNGRKGRTVEMIVARTYTYREVSSTCNERATSGREKKNPRLLRAALASTNVLQAGVFGPRRRNSPRELVRCRSPSVSPFPAFSLSSRSLLHYSVSSRRIEDVVHILEGWTAHSVFEALSGFTVLHVELLRYSRFCRESTKFSSVFGMESPFVHR